MAVRRPQSWLFLDWIRDREQDGNRERGSPMISVELKSDETNQVGECLKIWVEYVTL